ncbi:MAG: exo-alpha-sialidase [Verrucomicrobiae bacterium]|nr:exo-alpha-sialidase [Verrucomicrobiae bacterium]
MKTSLLLCLSSLSLLHADELEPPGIKRLVAVKDVCAWPALTLLPDGSINATLFGKPSHGQVAGAIGVWNSPDGEIWNWRGTPAPNAPETNRMNHAAGLAGNGDLLVLVSGWTNVKQPQRPKQSDFRDDILPIWVCRSSDGGKTWTQSKAFPDPDPGWTNYIPFGDIKRGEDGALHVSCYGGEFTDSSQSTKTKGYRSWHFRSDDDGRTWSRVSVIHPTGNETTVLHLGGQLWMAASRERAMDLFWSEDDGVTWSEPLRVTSTNEINGHLLQLKDGRLVLSYGCRVKDRFGVLAKLSSDKGKTWRDPLRLAVSLESDCGYPSTVQRPDGKLVTAWYAKATELYGSYQMGVSIWEAPEP